jgi:hypothetical protein
MRRDGRPVQIGARQKARDFEEFPHGQGSARTTVILHLPMNYGVKEPHPDGGKLQAGSDWPGGMQQRFRRQQMMAPTQMSMDLDGERDRWVLIWRMMEIQLEALRRACKRIAHSLQQARRGIELPRIDQHVEVDHLPPGGATSLVVQEPRTALERDKSKAGRVGCCPEFQQHAAQHAVAPAIGFVVCRQHRTIDLRRAVRILRRDRLVHGRRDTLSLG